MATTEELLSDPSISYWFKEALKSALKRDPIDALSDAELLLRALAAHAHDIQLPSQEHQPLFD
ncbi:MAG: hypothetical protein V1913_00795 [Fibrobacterota bacterium]